MCFLYIHALPLEEALASVLVRILLLLTPCAEQRSLHHECRAPFTAILCTFPIQELHSEEVLAAVRYVLFILQELHTEEALASVVIRYPVSFSCHSYLMHNPSQKSLHMFMCTHLLLYSMHYLWRQSLHPFMCAHCYSKLRVRSTIYSCNRFICDRQRYTFDLRFHVRS